MPTPSSFDNSSVKPTPKIEYIKSLKRSPLKSNPIESKPRYVHKAIVGVKNPIQNASITSLKRSGSKISIF